MLDRYLSKKLESSKRFIDFLIIKIIIIAYYFIWFLTILYIFFKNIVLGMSISNITYILILLAIITPTSFNVFLRSITVSYELLKLKGKLNKNE